MVLLKKYLSVAGIAAFSCLMLISFDALAKKKTRSCDVTYSAVVNGTKHVVTKYKHKASATSSRKARKRAKGQAKACVNVITATHPHQQVESCGQHLIDIIRPKMDVFSKKAELVKLRADSQGQKGCVGAYEETYVKGRGHPVSKEGGRKKSGAKNSGTKKAETKSKRAPRRQERVSPEDHHRGRRDWMVHIPPGSPRGDCYRKARDLEKRQLRSCGRGRKKVRKRCKANVVKATDARLDKCLKLPATHT